MANQGDTKTKFGRQFTFLNPETLQSRSLGSSIIGPGVWRLSTIDEIASAGSGSGSLSDINGVVPITSTTIAANEVDISLDLTNLPEKP